MSTQTTFWIVVQFRRNARRALAHIESLTSGRRPLDVGCAAGFFLARKRGWDVFGVEASEYTAGYARTQLALPVHRGSIQDPIPLEPGFHAVTMWDVIEHLDPHSAVLARVRDLLAPGGLPIVSTGGFGSPVARLLGRRWRLPGDPTDQCFFTATTLRRLIDACGFQTLAESRRGK